jgi:hypothetical protein
MQLFDGHAVLMELTPLERTRTQGVNVSDVLDAIVRLMRRPVRQNACADLPPTKARQPRSRTEGAIGG